MCRRKVFCYIILSFLLFDFYIFILITVGEHDLQSFCRSRDGLKQQVNRQTCLCVFPYLVWLHFAALLGLKSPC